MPERQVERPTVKLKATEQAAVFDELGVRTCWLFNLSILCNYSTLSLVSAPGTLLGPTEDVHFQRITDIYMNIYYTI